MSSWQEILDFIKSIPSTTCGGSQPQFLYDLSKATKGRGEIVEIGTHVGRSAIALAYAQKEKGEEKGGRPINTIDVNRHPQLDGHLEQAGVADFVNVTVSPSTIAAKDWDKPIELLWIDADHSRWGLRADIKAWRDHVIEGGVVAFHDYPGVDSSQTVAWPIARLMLRDPLHWRVVSDRDHGSIIAFERIPPDRRYAGKPSLPQRRKWAYREFRAWVVLHAPGVYAAARRRSKDKSA